MLSNKAITKKELILGYIDDLVADFLYYDRKNDEDIPPGCIERTIINSDITIDDIANRFREKLVDGVSCGLE